MDGILQIYSYSLKQTFKVFILILFCTSVGVAQKTDSTTIKSIEAVSMRSEKDSVMFTRLKKQFSKNKILNEIYNALFRDVYNQNASGQEIVQVEENPFKEYEGRVIRKIFVKRRQVFGESIIDTSRIAEGFDHFLNSLHTNTREKVIRNSFLMFDVGDIIDADRLRDNERLMRRSSILHDARILVIPDAQFPNLVDLLVITQDIWSLIPDVGFNGFKDYYIGINQVNFRGLGHSWRNNFYLNHNEKPALEYFSQYTIPYIGRTFITGQAEIELRRQTNHYAIRFYRPFLTPEMKLAGGLELSNDRNLLNTFRGFDGTTYKNTDTTFFYFPTNRNLVDFWTAYAFKLPFLSKEIQQRSRVVLGVRFADISYTQRPEVTADTNQIFRNHRDYLVGIGFSNRRYKRDFLIYGFGVTEDVPYGYLATFVTGYENSDAFGKRWYTGVKLAKGQYIGKAGYIYGLLNFGGYSNGTTGLSIESNYFSTMHLYRGRIPVRHFVNVQYAFGTQRYTGEFVNVNRENGILDANSDKLWGTKKLGIGYQIVFFSRLNFVGFRIAPFFQADFAFVNPRDQFLLNRVPYTGLGIGIRLRNENLTFNTFQLKFSFFPNLPDVRTLNFAFSDTYNLRLKDFDISAPEIVPFR
ncbi:MAG: hypothetical protein MUF58_14450 [Arcicella sp.]|jgi:hypothetical protein|nr:hypothetical protein [Arcicella sp.]